jgi:hypothetical protein
MFNGEEGVFEGRWREVVHWVSELGFHAAAAEKKSEFREHHASKRIMALTRHK